MTGVTHDQRDHEIRQVEGHCKAMSGEWRRPASALPAVTEAASKPGPTKECPRTRRGASLTRFHAPR